MSRNTHLHIKIKRKRDPLSSILTVLFIIILVVTVGTIGFRIFAHQKWIDAFVNGALIFTATSLIEPVHTYQGKVFMSFYNIISGIFALVLLGIILSGGLGAFKDEETEEDNCCCCQDNYVPNVFELLDEDDT